MDLTIVLKSGIVIGWFAFLFTCENLWPAAKKPTAGHVNHMGRNIALWITNIALSPLIVIPLSHWAVSIQLDWRPNQALLGFIFDIILLDFYMYWWHRANHEIKFLWRFHEIHHLDKFLDTTTAVRFHFGEIILGALLRVVMISLMGIPMTTVILFEALVIAAALFHHSNWRLPQKLEGALSQVIITPSIHWVHHEVHKKNTDSNYGTVFVFWDKLFGTKNKMARKLDMDLGVNDLQDRSLLALLIRPFVRK
jgi:sterol desaturase/sphingolipid hydroxylase (fatty acid hydroxylase superfamily)